MLDLLWLMPTFPLLGFITLVLGGSRLPRQAAAVVGAGSVGLSFAVAVMAAVAFLGSGEDVFVQELWTWMAVGNFTPGFSLYLDGLSLVMMLVITGVGFLIHVYATGYMAEDAGFARFFSYMNLFVAAMLMLVLGDNLVLLYLGWEGVGLCSYLLIGFWYTKPENGYAARKAFVVTRVGDTSMAIGLFLLFAQLGTLQIQELMQAAETQWSVGSTLPTVAALLLLGGAVGKSAQLPLQTWLPDAMAGPTPISALIHAATMVTAGVYLIARTHILFELAPTVQLLVAWIGVATLLLAGFTAMTQTDIKRILAYSTVSQIGYMFLGLGAGAWSASIFHLMTHAFFKALLFLGAGSVILAMHHEQNIFRMGALWNKTRVSFASFLIGGLALTAFPYTSGFFSKDEILLGVLEVENVGVWLWLGGVIGAFFTGLYTFRLIFIVFFGENRGHHCEGEYGGWNMSVPLIVLMLLSLAGGLIHIPVDAVFSHGEAHEEHHVSTLIHTIMIVVPLLGIGVSYLYYGSRTLSVDSLMASSLAKGLHRFWQGGWGFDKLYGALFVRPFLWLAAINRADLIDTVYSGLASVTQAGNRLMVRTQTGSLNWYALTVIAGAVILITLGVML